MKSRNETTGNNLFLVKNSFWNVWRSIQGVYLSISSGAKMWYLMEVEDVIQNFKDEKGFNLTDENTGKPEGWSDRSFELVLTTMPS